MKKVKKVNKIIINYIIPRTIISIIIGIIIMLFFVIVLGGFLYCDSCNNGVQNIVTYITFSLIGAENTAVLHDLIKVILLWIAGLVLLLIGIRFALFLGLAVTNGKLGDVIKNV
jgi:hypothetical protein